MNEQPLISIAAINYNNSKYVKATLESIRKQTYANIELIVVDDCSTDNSIEIITEWLTTYEGKHKLIRHEKNKGVAAACNSGVKNATGKYYSAIATDDLMVPGKTTVQAAILERSTPSVAAVYSDARLIDSEGQPIEGLFISRHRKFEQNPAGDIFEILLGGNYIPGMTFLFKKSVFDDIGPFDESLIYEDYDMWLRISKKYKILYSDFPSANYRIRTDSLSATIKNWGYSDAKLFLKHVGAPLPMERIKKIAWAAYEAGDEKTMQLMKEYAKKTEDRFFKAIWLLWKYKVNFPTAEIILKRVEGYCSVNVANWYIDLSIYKDIYGAFKTSNSSYFSSRK